MQLPHPLPGEAFLERATLGSSGESDHLDICLCASVCKKEPKGRETRQL